MSLKTEETTIGGRTLTVTQFPVMTALEMVKRVANALFPAMVTSGVGGLDLKAAFLFADLKPSELRDLCVDLLRCAQIKTTEGFVGLHDENALNRVFEGSVSDLLAAAAFAAEVNFGSFFADALAPSPQPSAKEASD